MRFPKIDDVAAELRDINRQELQPEDAEEGIDVRLQVYPDGQWAVRWGSSDYDQDHRGFWGASGVPGNNRRFSSKDVARDLIDQAKDQFAMNDGVDESRRQPSLPGFPDIPEKLDIEIPDMPMWEQIGGDVDPGAHGGTLARSDGDALELLKIQPVRAYVGDGEAAEVGFPFWTREGWYDLDDLNPSKEDVQSALQSIGMGLDTLEADFTPTQRALVIAEALLDYGVADEGSSGWSSDLANADDEVKWQNGEVETIADRLAEEDEEFRNEVLGHGEIKEKLEEAVQQMVDESAAQGWSQVDDQTMIDLDAQGYDDQSAFNVAEFGDAIAVNTDALLHPDFAREIGVQSDKPLLWSAVGTSELEGWLERNGYEVTDFGGRVPDTEGYAYAEHVIQRVAREMELPEETVNAAAEALDWWQEEIPGSTDGDVTIWAKQVEGE